MDVNGERIARSVRAAAPAPKEIAVGGIRGKLNITLRRIAAATVGRSHDVRSARTAGRYRDVDWQTRKSREGSIYYVVVDIDRDAAPRLTMPAAELVQTLVVHPQRVRDQLARSLVDTTLPEVEVA